MRIIDAREQHARRKPRPPEIKRHEAPVCGALMPLTGELCGRRVGHKDSHRSRWVMDDEARRRRGQGYQVGAA